MRRRPGLLVTAVRWLFVAISIGFNSVHCGAMAGVRIDRRLAASEMTHIALMANISLNVASRAPLPGQAAASQFQR